MRKKNGRKKIKLAREVERVATTDFCLQDFVKLKKTAGSWIVVQYGKLKRLILSGKQVSE